ncbi:MAG: hypothetical protein UW68_C0029G0012 [Candidatus Collierbacteria bacterium GW2011_GWB1_44_6]|uniref:26 kDa periplasmic immunogenic protein n=2 Tax=Candidatus Collieribacteriota TaxID=1752725 RepID=A0A0G1JMA9_9BACT|nr:MAG: hypothetical protein UV68_C0007G0003 [Candidatus Collierbacteria bacterium GW2011_GWC2_43_12]KKT72671.1 MAG: hypothetical protein UW68_C0029G0012 [Candidatus Collierbacteria bacterium GW2011_GWB1_44_6]KKT81950.1 MAG: hypothetical protein UW80_C0044G0007 [Microgenomates group bacterium GW2011_GWC1_44_9]
MDKTDLDVFIKWILGGLMILGAVYFFPWGDITWGRVILKNEAVVTVTGYAESEEKNQVAMFSAGVTSINDNKDTAVNEVNTKMTALIMVVKNFGIDEADIQTQQASVYQMQENLDPTLIGRGGVKLGQWNASNTISITLRDVDKAGELTDILNQSGANNVYGPNFQLDTSKKAEDKLMGAAVADAKVKAEAMAAASGAKLGKVVSINESGTASPVYPLFARAEAKSMDLAVPAPVEVGTTKISKTVTVVWSLR